MSPPTIDREAARSLLVERGLSIFAADEFLMRSLLTASEAATVLGVKDSRAARDTLNRWGVRPVGRGPGRTGENTYPADLVWMHHQNRPGRGWRKGQSTSPPDKKKESTMNPSSDAVPSTDVELWYANNDDVVAFASVMVDADWLRAPHDVVEFFSRPWKWEKEWTIWALAGRPRPPSPDDLAQARMLGGNGTLRQELERRHRDDTARWDEFTQSLDVLDAGGEPEMPTDATDTASNVLPLKRSRAKSGKTRGQ